MKICQQSVVLFLVVAVLLGAGFVASAGAQPYLYVAPDTTRESDGNTFTLDIAVSGGVTDLMGWDIAVTFDPTVIELTGVFEGSLPLLSGYPTFFHWYDGILATDSVHVNGAILGNTVVGDGVLFTLEFVGHSTGVDVTDVIIAHSVLRTGVNEDIAHDVEHGWVEVGLPIATKKTSWGVVKSLYAGPHR